VLGWLSRLVLAFALLGVLAHDGVKVLTANFSAADDAATAAREAVDAYRTTKDVQASYDAAVKVLDDDRSVTVDAETFTVAADGSITLVVVKDVPTLWMKHLGFMKDLTLVHQDGGATPVG